MPMAPPMCGKMKGDEKYYELKGKLDKAIEVVKFYASDDVQFSAGTEIMDDYIEDIGTKAKEFLQKHRREK